MPSNARDAYKAKYKIDVDRLIDEIDKTEAAMKAAGQGLQGGRRAYAHLGRSAVVMLCAALEAYVENILTEVVNEYYLKNVKDPKTLPNEVQKTICERIARSDHTQIMKLTGDGWKAVLRDTIQNTLLSEFGFSTPKPNKIDNWFNKYTGLKPMVRFPNSTQLDAFVEKRGNIAHSGVDAGYIGKRKLREYEALVDAVVAHLDKVTCNYLKKELSLAKQPWRNT